MAAMCPQVHPRFVAKLLSAPLHSNHCTTYQTSRHKHSINTRSLITHRRNDTSTAARSSRIQARFLLPRYSLAVQMCRRVTPSHLQGTKVTRPVQKREAVFAEAGVDGPLFAFLHKTLHAIHISRTDSLLQLHVDHCVVKSPSLRRVPGTV